MIYIYITFVIYDTGMGRNLKKASAGRGKLGELKSIIVYFVKVYCYLGALYNSGFNLWLLLKVHCFNSPLRRSRYKL